MIYQNKPRAVTGIKRIVTNTLVTIYQYINMYIYIYMHEQFDWPLVFQR